MKLIFTYIFKHKLYKRWKYYHLRIHRIEEYNRKITSGEIQKDDILAYLYYYQNGSWDELIERFGEIKVKQYEAIGYLKHYNKDGLWI